MLASLRERKQPINHPTNQSINQSVNELINKFINQSTDHLAVNQGALQNAGNLQMCPDHQSITQSTNELSVEQDVAECWQSSGKLTTESIYKTTAPCEH